MIRAAAFLGLLIFSAQTGAAADLTLSPPLACGPAEGCFIQQYLDHDPGPGAQDFTCGPLSYEGHQGTDFALPSRVAMRAGVAVLAAAPGSVRAVRDEMPDIPMSDPNAPDLKGRDCGNGVVIDHADGWQTQYCHMALGSVAVSAGDEVTTGAILGRVGLSGRTDFAHVHLTVRKDGAVVDPFAPDAIETCGAAPDHSLWATPQSYRAGGLITLGVATEVPDFGAIKDGLATTQPLTPDAPALVLWAYAFGGQAGDEMRFALFGPEGAVLAHEVTLDRTQARLFRAAGRRAPGGAGWPMGRYGGTATLTRDRVVIDTATVVFDVGSPGD